jgi:hypothetical protein
MPFKWIYVVSSHFDVRIYHKIRVAKIPCMMVKLPRNFRNLDCMLKLHYISKGTG